MHRGNCKQHLVSNQYSGIRVMVYNQDIILFVEQKMQLTEKFVSIELVYYELSQLTQQQTINLFWKCI